MIAVRHLTFGFVDRPIFDDLSLDLPECGLVAVTGANGVGKTTLLRVLGGIYRSGTEVRTASGLPARAVYLDDEFLTLDTLTVGEVLALLAAELPDLAADRLVDHPLVTDTMRHSALGTLSLGQRQRCVVAVASSLTGADAVLLDEPFNALDADGVSLARRELADLARARPVLFATHMSADIDDFAHHVLRIGGPAGPELVPTGRRALAAVEGVAKGGVATWQS